MESKNNLHLATFMDLFTREIVGWNVSTRHTKEFVVDAFLEAVISAGKPTVVHTDQGAINTEARNTSNL